MAEGDHAAAVERDGLGDWRIQAASRIMHDIPAAFAGGPSHKAGAPVHLVTYVHAHERPNIGFVTPSAPAMALSIAMKTSVEAERLKALLAPEDTIGPEGKGQSIGFTHVGPLYDFFEQCMVAVAFSFQALETFGNHTIANEMKGTFELARKKKKVPMTKMQLERNATPEEKFGVVLPALLGRSTPEGSGVWDGFQKLKRARDSTVHLKSTDQYPTKPTAASDPDWLFYQFLSNDPRAYVCWAVDLIQYFLAKDAPRWFAEPRRFRESLTAL